MRNSGDSASRSTGSEQPRILVVGVDWLGDALFMTPLFRALKARWPQAYLAASTASRNVPVLNRCADLDEVIPYDEVPFLLGLPDQQRLTSRFARQKFDTALLLHRSFTRALAAARARIPRRIGFSHTKRDWLLTERLNPPAANLHRIDTYLSILAPLGVAVPDRKPRIQPLAGDAAEWEKTTAAAGWKPGERMLTLHPGGNWDLKRWPIQNFAELARRASAAGWKVAVCGSQHEAELGRAIADAAPGGAVVSFCGRTGFGGLVGLLAASRLIVSNDSGPLHLAAALGTPVVGLFGPTLESLTGPVAGGPIKILHKDFGCELPCLFDRCVSRVCLDRLSVDEVWAAADETAGERAGR